MIFFFLKNCTPSSMFVLQQIINSHFYFPHLFQSPTFSHFYFPTFSISHLFPLLLSHLFNLPLLLSPSFLISHLYFSQLFFISHLYFSHLFKSPTFSHFYFSARVVRESLPVAFSTADDTCSNVLHNSQLLILGPRKSHY